MSITTVSAGSAGPVRLVEAHGRLEAAVDAVRHALLCLAADDSGPVLCALEDVVDRADRSAVQLLASTGTTVRRWSGAPLGVACRGEQLGRALVHAAEPGSLVVGPSRAQVLSQLASRPDASVVRQSLAPLAQSVAPARKVVTHACRGWGCPAPQTELATLVISELVTNAVLHAHTDLELSVARWGTLVRLGVRDSSAGQPQPQSLNGSLASGRGLLIIDAVSRFWGVLPTFDGGKVVWAVLDQPPDVLPALSTPAEG